MNVLKLIAQLGLDGRGFKAGLQEAKSASAKFGSQVSGDFKTAAAGFFSYQAFKSLVWDNILKLGEGYLFTSVPILAIPVVKQLEEAEI